jgi:hypothetical protein
LPFPAANSLIPELLTDETVIHDDRSALHRFIDNPLHSLSHAGRAGIYGDFRARSRLQYSTWLEPRHWRLISSRGFAG